MENFDSSDPFPKRSCQRKETSFKSKVRKISTVNRRATKNTSHMSLGSFGRSTNGGLCDELWMRIFELTDARFLSTRARLVCRRFKEIIDNCNSLFFNQRIEIYGKNMPGPPPGMSERQYNNLLGGKGCEECSNRSCTATKWAWYKRWCVSCWEKKISLEYKIIKDYEKDFPRSIILQLLDCLPYCMYDAYMKSHHVGEAQGTLQPSGPKVHKYYQTQDVAEIVALYKTLIPASYDDNPEHTPEERASAMAKYQDTVEKMCKERKLFLAQKKKERDELMQRVFKIENAIRIRRQEISRPNKIARQGRREFHTKMAKRELPHIPVDFVQKAKAYKASCRIYRNGGTDRTWKVLKPKIENEWRQELEKRAISNSQCKTNCDIPKSQPNKCSSIHLDSSHLRPKDIDNSDFEGISSHWQRNFLSANICHSQVMPKFPVSHDLRPVPSDSLQPYQLDSASSASGERKIFPHLPNLNIPRFPYKVADLRAPESNELFHQTGSNNQDKREPQKLFKADLRDTTSYQAGSRYSENGHIQYKINQIGDTHSTPSTVKQESSVKSNSSTGRTIIPISSLLIKE
ncbi:hypothetical protein EPUL_003698 [Erysiphe pulchra]|uniref:F-box domain-containing protein n=1 Tax=Erysiphe pulchra TaxID=225359 RepID=A0A2S4PZD0_9PEZI|nr:hypothetical protein EPUL_003698 [Erysiphe pulchra]